ncbi:MAG TPA: YjhG/YagF family D-xylonate dehydratase [Pyrinomonadaceae bacterium]|nr:YjhG/YagF family D-xylonate dehydratase [Pyrinomonadaceae bacterium]
MPEPTGGKPVTEGRSVFESDSPDIYRVVSAQPGPAGSLPVTADELIERPSGDLFGWTQDVGMGWNPAELRRPEVLILSTQGGIRLPDGTPLALGYHTGHYEVGLLMQAAAEELREKGCIPFAGYCTDPCDGRSQGTTGMLDSLPYRNDAAIVLRRLIRSLPNRRAVVGVATCDKGLPAMLMALAGSPDLPAVLVPGGVTLPASDGEDAGRAQTIGARFANRQLTLEEAADIGCRACASPGGGCQFLGTAATSQVVSEALGLSVPHSALAPSGQPVWLDAARRSARAVLRQGELKINVRDIVTDASVRNAMVAHAAFGGSTNLLLHVPAVAHAAGLRLPTVEDWIDVNRKVPRLVDALPNGPHPTVRVFLAGGVPEVMLHLRELGLIDVGALTAVGKTLDEVLDDWASSERRRVFRARLKEAEGIDPDDVIMPPARARAVGLTSTISYVKGNLAPQGAIVKSTAIDRALVGPDGVYRLTGPARVFTSERATIAAIKSRGEDRIKAGEVIVLICRGALGAGMEEVYQITSALKYMPYANSVALITDARFSGVSSGPCVGHVGPEALAGGPVGKLIDGDLIRVVVDTLRLEGGIDLVRESAPGVYEPADEELARREPRADLRADPALPADTRLWAALQNASGGPWRGGVYDVDRIVRVIEAGLRALEDSGQNRPR